MKPVKLKAIIEQLESKAAEFDETIVAMSRELQLLSSQGKVISDQIESLGETRQHYLNAISNIRAAIDIETPSPVIVDAPWGDI